MFENIRNTLTSDIKGDPFTTSIADFLRIAVLLGCAGVCFANSWHLIEAGMASRSVDGALFALWLHAGILPGLIMMLGEFETLEKAFSLSLGIGFSILFIVYTIWSPPVPFSAAFTIVFPVLCLFAFYLVWALADFTFFAFERLVGIRR